jgi:hypothetical protein
MKKLIYLIIISTLASLLLSCEEEKEPEPFVSIGDFLEGGVVFFVDETGEHGLVCAVLDQGSDINWGCPSLIDFGAKGLEIGTGQQNTLDIIGACNDSNTAAAICEQLELNGYNDWFLPSRDELDSLYRHREIIQETALKNNGGYFQSGTYWSSSHYLDNTVWVQHFGAGNQSSDLKDKENIVRAIRKF